MDKNFIAAIIFTTLIVVFFSSPYYQKKFGNPVQQQNTTETNGKSESINKETNKVISQTAKTDTSQKNIAQIQSTQIVTSIPDTQNVFSQINQPSSESEYVLENDLMKVTFSNKGATIKNVTLKKFDGDKKGSPVQMVPSQQNWMNADFNDDNLDIPGESILYNVTSTQESITFNAEFSDNRKIKRIFSFGKKDYLINQKISFSDNWKDANISLVLSGPLNQTERPYKQLRIWPFSMFMGNDQDEMKKVAFRGQGERITTDKSGKEKSKNIYHTEEAQKIQSNKSIGGKDTFFGELDWYSIKNKYFMCTVMPSDISRWRTNTEFKSYDGITNFNVSFEKKQSAGSMDMDIYFGPISYNLLKTYDNNLVQNMELSFRFIRPLSIAFLWTFKKINTIVPNWGLVVIIFSLLIKVLLYPLTRSSYNSMKKMQSLQPKLNELKIKYKSNPQNLQKATMELYKAEGINPFGGCLPLLLQMPVFFALYPVVGRAFELRQAMFIPGWINDLSLPDPFYILPIGMGISMFFQSKSTMQDPNQKAMLYVMPVMMVILFANFSAGLNLYWFMFNIFTFVQQKLHA